MFENRPPGLRITEPNVNARYTREFPRTGAKGGNLLERFLPVWQSEAHRWTTWGNSAEDGPAYIDATWRISSALGCRMILERPETDNGAMIATSIDRQLVDLSYRTRAGFNLNGADAFRRPRPAIGFKPAYSRYGEV